MLKGVIWEIEIPYPTNSGEYSYKKLFSSEEELNQFLEEWLKKNYLTIDDLMDVICEWDGYGPNWETVHVYKSEDDDVIIISKIDNDKEK